MNELLQFAIPENPDEQQDIARHAQEFVPQEPMLRDPEEFAVAAEALALTGLNPDMLSTVRLLRDLEAVSDKDTIGLAYYGSHHPKEYGREKNDLLHSVDLYARMPDTSEAHRDVATRIIDELFGSNKGERAA